MCKDNQKVTMEQKDHCAVSTMRRMLEKYSQEKGTSFQESLVEFANSNVYEALFDFETGLWMEGPDYLRDMWDRDRQKESYGTEISGKGTITF